MMHGREKSDLAIVAMKPANKANEPTAEASTGANAAEPVERRAGAKGNAHQQSTHWTQSQARVSQALERIRQAIAVIPPRWEKLWSERCRNEAVRAGRPIRRIARAYEAGRDGFWLARWLIARGIEAHVIHSASVAVSRERKRAKTDRLDAAMLMRVFLGWLRGERG